MKKVQATAIFDSLSAKADRLLEIAREQGNAELEALALSIAGDASALGLTAIGQKKKTQRAVASKPRKSKSVSINLLEQAIKAHATRCLIEGEPIVSAAWRREIADQLEIDPRTAKRRYAELGITEEQLLERLRSYEPKN